MGYLFTKLILQEWVSVDAHTYFRLPCRHTDIVLVVSYEEWKRKVWKISVMQFCIILIRLRFFISFWTLILEYWKSSILRVKMFWRPKRERMPRHGDGIPSYDALGAVHKPRGPSGGRGGQAKHHVKTRGGGGGLAENHVTFFPHFCICIPYQTCLLYTSPSPRD